MYDLVSPQEDHIQHIASRLRAWDRLEALAQGFSWTPVDGIEFSVSTAEIAETVLLGEEPVGVWGVCGSGCVWMVGTPRLGSHPKSFMEKSWECVERALEVSPTLWNYVHQNNSVSRRWLRRIGARFSPDVVDINGHPFKYFEIER